MKRLEKTELHHREAHVYNRSPQMATDQVRRDQRIVQNLQDRLLSERRSGERQEAAGHRRQDRIFTPEPHAKECLHSAIGCLRHSHEPERRDHHLFSDVE